MRRAADRLTECRVANQLCRRYRVVNVLPDIPVQVASDQGFVKPDDIYYVVSTAGSTML